MHLDGVFLDAAGSVVLAPPVEREVAADFKPVVDEAVVGAEPGVGFLEVASLNDTVMVKIADRK